jgi:hypothetical protein
MKILKFQKFSTNMLKYSVEVIYKSAIKKNNMHYLSLFAHCWVYHQDDKLYHVEIFTVFIALCKCANT